MSDMLDSIAPDVDIAAEMGVESQEPAQDAAQEPAQSEPQKEPAQEIPKDTRPPKMVPVDNVTAAHAKAREWRDRAERAEREAAEQVAKLKDQLKQFQNPVPKFEEDPANNLRHEAEATKARLAEVEKAFNQTRQAEEARAFEQQIAVHTQSAEQAFAATHPDYNDAVKYLQSVADRNLQLMGLDDPAARQAQIRQDAMAMSLKALQAGKNPAEVAYQLANNYGYKAVQQPDPAKKLATLQQGQKASASLPSGGKSSPMSIEALAQLDDDEFNKAIDDPATWKKLISQA